MAFYLDPTPSSAEPAHSAFIDRGSRSSPTAATVSVASAMDSPISISYSSKGKQRAFEVSEAAEGEPHPYPHPMERIERRPTGMPSHVAWLGSTQSLDRPAHSHSPWPNGRPYAATLARSASAGMKQPKFYMHPMHKSTQSLPYYAIAGTPGSEVRPLSPIDEQVHFPPERLPSPTNSEDICTDGSYIYPNDSQYDVSSTSRAAFITRPLNRSTSLGSSKTFTSTVPKPPYISPLDLRPPIGLTISLGSSKTLTSTVPKPPYIPPLDLRPPFGLTIPPHVSRGSPTTPHTFASSPLKYTATVTADETSSARSESFRTAPSVLSQSEFEEDSEPAESLKTSNQSNFDSASPPRPASLPNFHEFGVMPAPPSPPVTPGATIATVTPHSSRRASFLAKLWLTFGRDRSEFPEHKPFPIEPACALFWLGFIAPWTWLIGGWLLTANGKVDADVYRSGGILPLWMHGSGSAVQEKGKGKEPRQRSRSSVWNPFAPPSLHSLAASSASGGSRFSVGAISKLKLRNLEKTRRVAPWVVRCRIAAVTGSLVILVCFIVALVVAGRSV